MKPAQILVIGGAVADVSLGPVDRTIFDRDSTPVDHVSLSTGGDALNEATTLARLGHRVRLVTLLGTDPAGDYLLEQCRRAGLDCSAIVRDPQVVTSVNAVLVDRTGERRFVTAKDTSLRRLGPEHTALALKQLDGVQIASFASLFVSPRFGPQELEDLFAALHRKRILVCTDMTRPKNGERAEDLAGALQYVDFFFANLEEGRMFTGETDPEAITQRLVDLGVRNVALKLGADGCYYRFDNWSHHVPAYSGCQCVDTTGAGDTFVAAFLHGLLWGIPRWRCADFANAAASACVEHTGCASGALEMEEIERRAAVIRDAAQ